MEKVSFKHNIQGRIQTLVLLGGGGSNWARGQESRLGPLVGPGQSPDRVFRGDGKRFSVFEMHLEGLPL